MRSPLAFFLCSLLFIGQVARPSDLQSIPSAQELERTGAVVGKIYVDPQNIFDLNDPKDDKSLFRLANKLHIKTREGVIREQLLFHTGETYSQR